MENSRADIAGPGRWLQTLALAPSHAFAVVGAAWIFAVFLLPIGSIRSWSVAVVAALSLLAAFISFMIHRIPNPIAAGSIIAALSCFLIARVARTEMRSLGKLVVEASLWPAILEVFGYLLIGGVLIALSRRRSRRQPRNAVYFIDRSIIGLGILGSAWLISLGPLVFRPEMRLDLRFTLISHPAMSLFLVVLAARFPFARGERRSASYWYLFSGLSFLFVGDMALMVIRIAKVHPVNPMLSIPYALAYILTASSFIHPSFPQMFTSQAVARVSSRTDRVLWVAASLVMPLLLVLEAQGDSFWERTPADLLAGVLAAMAALRIFVAMKNTDRLEAELLNKTERDDLTGLPNRKMAEKEVRRVLDAAADMGSAAGVFHVNVDGLRVLNATFGRTYGDEVLINVAQCLIGNVTNVDAVVRLGDDDFVVIIARVFDEAEAIATASSLQNCVGKPFVVHGSDIRVTVTIGIVLGDASGARAPDSSELRNSDRSALLMQAASTAAREARRLGVQKVALYDKEMGEKIAARLELEGDLAHAVERRELRVEFQPIIALPSGVVSGAEALLRWDHPRLGTLAPAEFIPLAEETGAIESMGSWVLDEALAEVAVWRRCPDLASLTVAVNVSAVQLANKEFVHAVQEKLAKYGLPGSALCLELTESVVMRDPVAAAAIFSQLRELDVSLALDDFGTAYSSLAYLHRLPANHLKIDRSFVTGEEGVGNSAATLLQAIVAMARALGIETVAEGVETPFELERVLALGCDSVQGFIYSKPVCSQEMMEITRSINQRVSLDKRASSPAPS